MPCEILPFRDGGHAIVCTRGRTRRPKCRDCGKAADLQCDYALTGKAAGRRCDRHICAQCATSVGRDMHYCRVHQAMAERVAKASGKPVAPTPMQQGLFAEASAPRRS